MVLWLRKQFWGNCRKKQPGVARFTLQVQKHFKNRKNWQKKVIPIDASMVIQIAFLITPTKLLADSPRRIRSIPNFFHLFCYPQKPFIGLVFGTRFDNLLRFCPKWTRFCPPSVKTNKQSKNIPGSFFPQVVHLVVLNAVVRQTPTNDSAEGTENVTQMPFFFFSGTKIFLGLFFGTRLDNLLPIADNKTKFHASSPKTDENKIEVFFQLKSFQFCKLIVL